MRLLIWSVCLATSNPAMLPRPSLGSSNPHNIRITVDLPEPFGPRNPKMAPLPTLKLTWSTAVNCPNRRVRPSHSIMVSDILSRHLRKRHIRRHSRPQFAVAIIEPQFHAKNLFDAFA